MDSPTKLLCFLDSVNSQFWCPWKLGTFISLMFPWKIWFLLLSEWLQVWFFLKCQEQHQFEIYAKIASFLLWHLQRVNLIWNHQLGKNNCLLEVCNKHKNCLVLMIVTCLSQLIKNQVFWAFQLIFTTLARVRVKKKWLKKGQKCTFQISWNITFWKSTKILQWLWFLPIFWNLTERRFKSFGQYLEKWGGNNLPKDW